MPVQVQKRLFTVDEYYKMAESGIFHEDDRVELIEGEIIEMSPIGNPHARCVRFFIHVLSEQLRGKAILDVQNPVRLDFLSEPQPDLILLNFCADFYQETHPGPGDVLLLIEVADSSREFDRQIKAPLYAKHNIPELWIIDLEKQGIEIYRDPQPDGYKDIQTFRPGDKIAPQAFPECVLPVNDILGI